MINWIHQLLKSSIRPFNCLKTLNRTLYITKINIFTLVFNTTDAKQEIFTSIEVKQ